MKCINCYKEIKDSLKFCKYCGTKQPADRAAYEREHPELAYALPEEDVNDLIKQQREMEAEQKRQLEEQQKQLEEQQRQLAEQQQQWEEQQQQQQQQQQNSYVINATMPEAYGNRQEPAMPPASNPPAMQQGGNMAPQQAMPQPQAGSLVVSAPQNAAPMTQCQHCGQVIPANAQTCPYCGVPVHQAHYNASQAVVPSVATMAPSRPAVEPYTPTPSDGGDSKKILIVIAAVLGVGILGLLLFYLFQKNKATYLVTDTNELFFSRKGGDKVVKITTDGNDFDISEHPDWLKVSKSGEGITVNCASRDANDDRSGTIMLKSGRISTPLKVTQRAYATFIKLSETNISMGKDGGSRSITIQTDGGGFNYTAPDYCTVNNLTDQGFTINVNHNSGKHRDGVVKITDGKNVGVLTISQKGVCSSCGGDGRVTCSVCYGSGVIYDWNYYWNYSYSYSCSNCDGRGTKQCSKCGGSGVR